MSTIRLTAAQALVRFLARQHSERDGVVRRAVPAMLGIFGHGNVCGLGEALAGARDAVPFEQGRHEQAMVHTALGYAKAQRRLSALACTASIGPGALNLVTGAGTATTNRLPVLLVAADTFASRRQGPVLQQLQHPSCRDWTVNEALRPVSRFFDRVSRPEQLLDTLPAAIRVLLDPAEAGAVTIALHQDTQGEAYAFPARFFAERTWQVARRPPEPGALEAVAALVRTARRPLVIAGGGVWHSEAEVALRALCTRHGLPLAETSAGKGMGAGELCVGGIGVNGTRAANRVAESADVVVCIGTRLSDFTTASRTLFQAPGVAFAGINVDPADAHHLGGVAVVADARAAIEALDVALGNARTEESYRADVRAAVAAWDADVEADLRPRAGEALTQAQVLATVNASVRAGDWVVAAAGSPPGDLLKLWRCPEGSFAHLEFGFSCMGHELPAALGIRRSRPDAGEVIALIGDGTYLMAPTELATAVAERRKITAVVIVNQGFQSIHGLQRSTTALSFGNEFAAEVDFAANARSLGCSAWDVAGAGELGAALAEARAGDRPAVIVCQVEPRRLALGSGAWWDLGVPEVSGDPEVARAAAAHAAGARRQRFHG